MCAINVAHLETQAIFWTLKISVESLFFIFFMCAINVAHLEPWGNFISIDLNCSKLHSETIKRFPVPLNVIFFFFWFRDLTLKTVLKWPSMGNVGKFFFGSEYENNFDIKFCYNLCARCTLLLLLFLSPVTFILGPPKYQKFRHFSWFCQKAGKFLNSPKRYEIQFSLVKKSILLTHV